MKLNAGRVPEPMVSGTRPRAENAMTPLTFGLADSEAALRRLVGALRDHGFQPSDIAVLFLDEDGGGPAASARSWLDGTGCGSVSLAESAALIASSRLVLLTTNAASAGAKGAISAALVAYGLEPRDADAVERRVLAGEFFVAVAHRDDLTA